MKLALTFYSVLKMPIKDIITCSIASEKAGFEYISAAESFYRDAFVLSSAIASKTNRIKFGSSIIPIHTRTPFQIAMASTTLNEISNGRLGYIGLGIGYRSRIEKYFGVKIEKSSSKMKEYVEIIRGLLSGTDFSYHGKFFDFTGFPKLVSRPLKIPILFGSSGDKMIRLAGRVGDGLVLNSIGTREYYKHVLSVLHDARRDASRKSTKYEIASSVIFSVSDKHEEAVNAARHDVLFYVLYPELDPVIAKTPYVETVKEIRKTYAQGKTNESLLLISDKMVEDLSVCGTAKECRKKMRKLFDFGITLPIIRVSVQPFKENRRKQVFLEAINSLKRI
ncbi:MAG: LLM class flavin-dependent oxidoreductase [Thaumarchaeota archaeon]|nr:LLM class flavin-dependent oxidoreductase [Nitrososphaerota archaeon]